MMLEMFQRRRKNKLLANKLLATIRTIRTFSECARGKYLKEIAYFGYG